MMALGNRPRKLSMVNESKEVGDAFWTSGSGNGVEGGGLGW